MSLQDAGLCLAFALPAVPLPEASALAGEQEHSVVKKGQVVIASDVLSEIAEKLRRSEKLTAMDIQKLHRVGQALAQAYGYQDIKDVNIFLDAARELQESLQKEILPKEKHVK